MTVASDVLTPFQLGLLGFPVLLILAAFRIPLGAAMFATGLLGTYLLTGNFRAIDNQLKSFAYASFINYGFSIIPLFLLMSEFATRGGLSAALFRAAGSWLGHRKGGLAQAAVGASAGFGAICGSSLATASSMGKVALPELRKAGYAPSLATGSLAAGGTLGILIPPSIVLVIYAILAEENIERLFTAALIPGLLAMLGYMLTIRIVCSLRPDLATQYPKASRQERWTSLVDTWPVIAIFTLVIGGIYTGAFSPTAAAAVGVAGTALVAWWKRALTADSLKGALLSTAKTTGMIFFIILAAAVFNAFLASAKVPQTLAEMFIASQLSPWVILTGMLLLYVVLGMIMDSLAMIFLTVPIFVPIVLQLDFGMPPAEVGLWFGILVLMAAEIGLITPPVGLNLFVINAMARDVPIAETYRGVFPFILSDVLRIVILVAFPVITLGLVRLFY
ncbi:MAG: TRAP transporter large permease [Pseudomonadota bacterium]